MEKLLAAQEAPREEKREGREQPDPAEPSSAGAPGEGTEPERLMHRGAIEKRHA